MQSSLSKNRISELQKSLNLARNSGGQACESSILSWFGVWQGNTLTNSCVILVGYISGRSSIQQIVLLKDYEHSQIYRHQMQLGWTTGQRYFSFSTVSANTDNVVSHISYLQHQAQGISLIRIFKSGICYDPSVFWRIGQQGACAKGAISCAMSTATVRQHHSLWLSLKAKSIFKQRLL